MKKTILFYSILFHILFLPSLIYADIIWPGRTKASRVKTNISNFDVNLSSTDTNAQKAFETLDELTGGTTSFLGLNDTPSGWDSGKYFKSWTSSGTWETPAGVGDMEKATYDIGANDIVDNSEALAGYAYTFFLDTTTAASTYLTSLATGTITQVYNANTDVDSTDDIIDGDFGTAGLMKTDGAGSYSVIFDSSTNWNTAHVHSQDNTQAHSDYLLNDADDSTTGKLTMSSGTVTNQLTVGSLSSSGQVTSNSRKVTDTIELDAFYIIASTTIAGTTPVRITAYRDYAITITTMTVKGFGSATCVGMIEQRAKGSDNSAGTDIWSSDITISTTTYSGGTISDYTVPAGSGLWFVPTSWAGDVDQISFDGKGAKD